MRAIQVTRFGGPEVLELVDIDDPRVPSGYHLVDVEACGVNFADTHAVENTYLRGHKLPFVPGSEVIGRLPDGRRMCGFTIGMGGYAERAAIDLGASFEVPVGVSDTAALSLLVQGLTAWHLVHTAGRVALDETVVVHAAAGGVGSLAVQLAKLAGAGRVIGLASTAEKREQVLALGADAVVDSTAEDLGLALRQANGGKRVDVVFEMTGGRAFDQSREVLARFGRLVTFGMASRVPASPVDPGSLMVGSTSIIGFWLADCLAADRLRMVATPLAHLVEMVANGKLQTLPGATYPLADARRAHEDLLARRTTGKTVLIP